ncbi:MAG: hypothetical protein Kow0059_08890 [Candidatus Sumerlaeia bacterium]
MWFVAFQALNAFSFNIGLGAPLVLLAHFIGAAESAIGVLLALTPFMACLQLAATNYADRLGYKRLMLMGWSLRAFMFLPIAVIPLLHGRVPNAVLIWMLIAYIFAFTAIRGFASGAWFPWISLIVPPSKRGHFLGAEQLAFHVFVLISLFVAGLILGESPPPWRYTVIYVLAWASAMVSIGFLRRVPCPMPPEARARSRRRWRDVWAAVRRAWAYSPYRQTTRYAAVHGFAFAAVGGFLIVFLRQDVGWSEGLVLKLAAGQTAGLALTSLLWGRLSDRTGSRPLMRVALTGYMGVLVTLGFCALGWFTLTAPLMAALYVFLGFFDGAHAIPQSRLAMAACPAEELTVGMAFYQVVVAVARGGSALMWGVVIENLRRSSLPPFAVFFWSSVTLVIAAQLLLTRISEPRAHRTRQVLAMLFWQWPQRLFEALPGVGGWQRRKRP